jgi:hypothetical protein
MKNINSIKRGLEYALKILQDQADKGLYPESALQENGGEGFKPITDALESVDQIATALEELEKFAYSNGRLDDKDSTLKIN